MTRGRKPRRDELELWRQIARRVSPLKDSGPQNQPPEVDETAPRRPRHETDPLPMPMPRIAGRKSPVKDDLAPALAHGFDAHPIRMDHKAHKRLRRGRLQPDARIDLHGMTLDRAHAALVRFVMAQHQQRKRLLLVITGKGRMRPDDGPIPARPGILRHQVPDWLRQQPLAGVVLQVIQAHPSHGGSGAYYVYLRKSR